MTPLQQEYDDAVDEIVVAIIKAETLLFKVYPDDIDFPHDKLDRLERALNSVGRTKIAPPVYMTTAATCEPSE